MKILRPSIVLAEVPLAVPRELRRNIAGGRVPGLVQPLDGRQPQHELHRWIDREVGPGHEGNASRRWTCPEASRSGSRDRARPAPGTGCPRGDPVRGRTHPGGSRCAGREVFAAGQDGRGAELERRSGRRQIQAELVVEAQLVQVERRLPARARMCLHRAAADPAKSRLSRLRNARRAALVLGRGRRRRHPGGTANRAPRPPTPGPAADLRPCLAQRPACPTRPCPPRGAPRGLGVRPGKVAVVVRSTGRVGVARQQHLFGRVGLGMFQGRDDDRQTGDPLFVGRGARVLAVAPRQDDGAVVMERGMSSISTASTNRALDDHRDYGVRAELDALGEVAQGKTNQWGIPA